MDRKRVKTDQQSQNIKLASFTRKRKKTVHDHVSKGSIRRLARKGGVKRLSALIYDEMRNVLRKYLECLIKSSLIYCEYSKRKTVFVEDVLRAIKGRGERLYGFDEPSFPISFRSAVILTDTPEESVASTPTVESSETPAIEVNAEGAPENTAEPSDRVLENSDTSLPDISSLMRKSKRHSSVSGFRGKNIQASGSGDSENLIPTKEKALPVRKSKKVSLVSEVRGRKHIQDSEDRASENSESLIEENKTLPVRKGERVRLVSEVCRENTEASEDGDSENSESLISTEENKTLPAEENRKSLITSKTTLRDRPVNPAVPNTSNSGAMSPDGELSLEERRKKISHELRDYKKIIQVKSDSGAATVNNEKLKRNSTINPSDSDDFENSLDILVRQRKRRRKK